MTTIKNIEDLQQFLVSNWDSISDAEFQNIINKCFNGAMAVYRRDTAEAEIEYMNCWIECKEERMPFYGTQISSPYRVNDIFNLNTLKDDSVRTLMFQN